MEDQDDKKIVKDENKIRLFITVVIVISVLSVLTIFIYEKIKSSNGTIGGITQPNGVAALPQQSGHDSDTSGDAGAIGKNEIKFTDTNFQAKALDYKGVVLVDFYASWCPHCKKIAKNVTDASDNLVGKAEVGKLDVEQSAQITSKYGIQSTPTFIVFKNGKEVAREVGEKTTDELISLVNSNL